MRLMMPRTSHLLLTLLFVTEQWSLSPASYAPVAQKLSITTLDYVQTLHWKPITRHTNLTESQTPPVQQRYTVYIKSTESLEFSCDTSYIETHSKWHRLENCVNTTAASCEVHRNLHFVNDYFFLVASPDQSVNMEIWEERSDKISYAPLMHDDMTFSAPRFTAKRLNPSNVIILFHPVTKPWWDCGNLTNFLSEMGIKFEYIIEYYGCPGDPNDPTCRHNAQEIRIPATKASINLTTKIAENTTICVEVKIFFDEHVKVYSNVTKVCLAPHAAARIPNKTLMLVGLAVTAVIFIILVVWFCRRSGKQLFHKLFRVEKVPEPAVSKGIWKDDSSVAVRLTNSSHEEEKEVAVPLNLGLFNLTKEQPAVEEIMKDVKQQQSYVLVSCKSASYDESETQESNPKQPLITSDFAYKNIEDLMMDSRRKVAQQSESQKDANANSADSALAAEEHSYTPKKRF